MFFRKEGKNDPGPRKSKVAQLPQGVSGEEEREQCVEAPGTQEVPPR